MEKQYLQKAFKTLSISLSSIIPLNQVYGDGGGGGFGGAVAFGLTTIGPGGPKWDVVLIYSGLGAGLGFLVGGTTAALVSSTEKPETPKEPSPEYALGIGYQAAQFTVKF